MASDLAPELLALLVCPEDRQALWYFADHAVLYNERLQRVYEIRDGIPVLLVDDARPAAPGEHTAFMAGTDTAIRTGVAQ